MGVESAAFERREKVVAEMQPLHACSECGSRRALDVDVVEAFRVVICGLAQVRNLLRDRPCSLQLRLVHDHLEPRRHLLAVGALARAVLLELGHALVAIVGVPVVVADGREDAAAISGKEEEGDVRADLGQHGWLPGRVLALLQGEGGLVCWAGGWNLAGAPGSCTESTRW